MSLTKSAEMDKVRAEARENVLQIALDGQAKFAAELVGLLARCTVMMGQGSATLRTAFGDSPVYPGFKSATMRHLRRLDLARTP